MTIEDERTISFILGPPAAKQNALKVGRTPRITRLMALALHFQDLLQEGTVRHYADLARLGGVTPARMTQIMNLLNLAPDIQEALLFLSNDRDWRDAINERSLRATAKEPLWHDQRRKCGFLAGVSIHNGLTQG